MLYSSGSDTLELPRPDHENISFAGHVTIYFIINRPVLNMIK